MLVLMLGCAQIRSTTTVTLVPKSGAKPRMIGTAAGVVIARNVDARWRQELDVLTIELQEQRVCRQIVHVPVTRVERTERTASGSLWWEYGLAAVLIGAATFMLARPQSLSATHYDAQGNRVTDYTPSYRLGGIVGGIGVILLGAGIYDSIRSRDSATFADAYRLERGAAAPCSDPDASVGKQRVELIVGTWQASVVTDVRGQARFVLPPESDLAQLYGEADAEVKQIAADAEREQLPKPPTKTKVRNRKPPPGSLPEQPSAAQPSQSTHESAESRAPSGAASVGPALRRAVIRLDRDHAIAVDFVVPYGATDGAPHIGSTIATPQPRAARNVDFVKG